MQRHNGNGGAVDNSRGYVVKLDTLSPPVRCPPALLGNSMQTTLYSLHCIDSAKGVNPLHNKGRITAPLHLF